MSLNFFDFEIIFQKNVENNDENFFSIVICRDEFEIRFSSLLRKSTFVTISCFSIEKKQHFE